MGTLFCFVFVAFPLLVIAESIAIENCNDQYIAIRRNANNTIVCNGFNQSHTVEWSIQRQQKTQVATCGPSSNCTVHQPDLYAVERSPTQSRLFYQHYDLDIVSMVFCESHLAGTKRTASCALDVINPAMLSRCTVEEDRDKGTVTGRCRFEHAYSSGRGFFCTWYQEKDDKSKRFSGNIMFDSGSFGPSGWCTFTGKNTTWEPGPYTYSILFYPGPGKITVYVGNTEGQIAGDLQIESCKDGFIDIREKANNTIVCKGFNQEDTIRWTFEITGSETPVATCDSDNCIVHEADHFAVERSPRQSKLFYKHREVGILASVTCTSRLGHVSGRSTTCSLNVINPAELSNCSVEEDRDNGTVTGRCRFDHAYSYSRGFLCTWYQDKNGMSRLFLGTIMYDSDAYGPSGVCSFSSTDLDIDPGTYTYSINFYPGPGNITVNVKNTENSTSEEQSFSSIAAIVGGCGGVVVIVGAIVIVVVKIKKRDKTYAKPTRRPRNAEPEHVYNDLHNDTPTTTTTTTATSSSTTETTTGNPHNQHGGYGNNLDNVHQNPVYVNENQPGEESLCVQQHHTYVNDHPETAQGDVGANRDSNPYYSEIKDTGIN